MNVYYGDYGHANGDNWWIEQCVNFHDTIEFDGLWVVSSLFLLTNYMKSWHSPFPKMKVFTSHDLQQDDCRFSEEYPCHSYCQD